MNACEAAADAAADDSVNPLNSMQIWWPGRELNPRHADFPLWKLGFQLLNDRAIFPWG